MKIERRKGFRQQFVALRPYQKIMCGLTLFLAAMLLIIDQTAAHTGAVLANAPGIAITLQKDGLSGDELAAIEKLEKRFNKLPAAPTKDELMLSFREAFPSFYDKDGKPKAEMAEMVELLGNTEKGLRSILKTQGEELLKLKTQFAENGGQRAKLSLRSALAKSMDKVEEVYKTGKDSKREHVLNIRAAAVMTTDNTITGDDALPDELIESFSVASFVGKRYPREYVFDLANRTIVSETTQFKTWLEEGSAQGALAVVAEGGLKPLVSYDLVRNHTEVKKVAAKYIVTEEFTKFRKSAYAIIQRLIRAKLLRDYAAILTTDLIADAAPYVASALDGQYNLPTDYHAIAAVAAQIESLDFAPDMLILNPQDKWRIGMSQDNNGQFYLTIPITDPTGNTRMMGFIVRTSNRVQVGKFLLGESGLWEIEEEALSIRIGYGVTVTGGTSNGGGNVTDVQSDIDHNRFRVIVETFFHNWIATNNEGSFVYADFDEVKEAVTA